MQYNTNFAGPICSGYWDCLPITLIVYVPLISAVTVVLLILLVLGRWLLGKPGLRLKSYLLVIPLLAFISYGGIKVYFYVANQQRVAQEQQDDRQVAQFEAYEPSYIPAGFVLRTSYENIPPEPLETSANFIYRNGNQRIYVRTWLAEIATVKKDGDSCSLETELWHISKPFTAACHSAAGPFVAYMKKEGTPGDSTALFATDVSQRSFVDISYSSDIPESEMIKVLEGLQRKPIKQIQFLE